MPRARVTMDVSDRFRGQLRFLCDNPGWLRSDCGFGGDLSPDLTVINQDLAPSLRDMAAARYDLAVTPAAEERLAELADESPVSTPSFHPPFELKGYQRRACNVMRHEPRVMLQLSPGTGKAQPLRAKVLTPGGFERMGDLSVGDMVCSSDGRFYPVTGVYDRGELEMFEVELSDGNVVECCADHLWKVTDHKVRGTGERSWRCMSTSELLSSGVRNGDGRPRYKVPVMGAVEYPDPDEPLPVDPYVLGVLIGDGCLTCRGVVVSTSEPDMLDRVVGRLGASYSYRRCSELNYSWSISSSDGDRSLSKAVSALGLRVRSFDKFIPDAYLTARVDDRRELLRGLFDTDGCVMGNGSYTYSTTSPALRDGFVRLCRELGYVTWVGVDGRDGGVHRHVAYTVGIRTNDAICSSAKHARRASARVSEITGARRSNDVLSISDVRRTGRFEEARCISVASPDSTYVTDGWAVTHNTTTSLAMACQRRDAGECGRVVVVCPAALIGDWVRTIESQTSMTVATPSRSWGAARRRGFYASDGAEAWVLNYERFRLSDRDAIEGALAGSSPLFVLDEVQKVANRASAMHRGLAKTVKAVGAAGVIALTATPMVRGPEDFYNEFRIVDSQVFGGVADFERDFTEMGGAKDQWGNYVGFRDLPYMHARAGAEVFSADKHRPEIAREFPAKDEQLVTYDLSPEDGSLYDEIWDYGDSLDRDVRQGTLFYLQLFRLCNMPETLLLPHGRPKPGPYADQLARIDAIVARRRESLVGSKNSEKLAIATEKVGEMLDAGEKVVVFARHTRNCILPLAEHWRKWRPLLFTGSQGPAERDEAKEAFKRSCDRNLMLMSDAGQVGLNLQESRYLLHWDTPASRAAYDQRSDRVHRVDSSFDSVTVVRMMARGTVEERAEQAMQGRLAMSMSMGFGGAASGACPLADRDADAFAFDFGRRK